MNNIIATVKLNGRDVNGNKKYLYNFKKDGIDYSKEFNFFGRITKNGISSQFSPERILESCRQFGLITEFKVGKELNKAQKDIDKCNNRSGCNHMCHQSQIRDCRLVNHHSQMVSLQCEVLAIVRHIAKNGFTQIN